jgi:TonB-linked SusC/RagA family outer membrane protein
MFAISLLLLFGSLTCAFAQGNGYNVVKGVVTDNSGDPLPGVSVLVKNGANNGVSTDIDGKYRLEVKSDGVLVFSFLGMKTVEMPVNGRSIINVKMRDDAAALDQVIVVGYGTQKKQSLTGAISAVKGGELLKAPSTNVSSLLGGKLPGISSIQTSGQPGDDQAALRIRGAIAGVTYIVDGIPRSINDIDPNDIASVSVLKDGASAAVYGLNAAGGVIIVTTKKGEIGAPKVTYDLQYGVSMNANFPTFMNGPQFAYYYNMADMMDKLASGAISSRDEYTPVFTEDNLESMLNGDPSDGWDNVNYIKKVFGVGTNMKHNLTLQGSTGKLKYYASLGYLDQQGNIDNFTYRRYNLRTNFTSDLGNGFKVTLGVSGNVGKHRTPGYSSGGTDAGNSEEGFLSIAHQTIAMHPYLPEKYEGVYTSSLSNNTSLANSPLAAIYESGYKKHDSFDLSSNLTVEYNIPWIKGLSLKGTGSYDYGTSHDKNLDTPYSTYTYSLSKGSYTAAPDPRGYTVNYLGEGQYSTQQLVGQLSLNYVNSFGKHNMDAMVLTEARDWKCNSLSAYAKDIPIPSLPELGFGKAADSPIGGWSNATRTAGYVFRVNYDYDKKYLAEISGRYDGSYKFSGNVSNKRWGFFPAISLGWRISKENFMKDINFIDELKLRASVGLLGNDDVSAYSYLSTYSFGGKRIINGETASSMYTSSIANPNLGWSKTLSSNVGFDLTMWDGLLGVTADAFYNYTYDILTYMGGNVAPSMGGYYFTYENYNKIDVKGFDLSLTHKNKFNFAGKPFNYNLTANISYARNRYLRYPDSPNTQNWRKVTGTCVDKVSGWIAEGLFRSEEEITNSAWYGTRPNVGDIKYKDLNGDGIIDELDKARIGRSNRPQLTFGFNIGGTWNGFDFNAQFTGGALFDVSLTGTYYNGYDDNTIWTQTFKEGANSPLYLVKKAYSIDNPNGTFPRITLSQTGHGGDNGLASTFWFRDGKYVRLKSAQIGYTLPEKWMKMAGIAKVRIYVEGSNLFTIDDLPEGIDPEAPRVNNGYYPQQKTIMGGFSITF